MSHQSKPSNSDRKPSSNGNNNISTSSNGNLKENVNGSQLQFSSTTSTAANHHQHQSILNQHIPLSPQAPSIFSNRTPLGDHIGGQQMGGTQPMVPPGVVAIYLACSKIYNNQPNPLQVTAVRKYWWALLTVWCNVFISAVWRLVGLMICMNACNSDCLDHRTLSMHEVVDGYVNHISSLVFNWKIDLQCMKTDCSLSIPT